MVKSISILSIIICTIGIFFGFYYLANNPQLSLKIVTITTVGIGGILAFVRHVIFHKSDAKRLGWETDRPDWIFEVGFANFAFGFMGLLAVIADWGTQSYALVILGYAFYFFQAAMLHGYRYFTNEKKLPERLWRFVLLTLLIVGMMTFFAINALLHS